MPKFPRECLKFPALCRNSRFAYYASIFRLALAAGVLGIGSGTMMSVGLALGGGMSHKMMLGRGLYSFTFQLNLSRFGYTSPSPRAPLSNRLGENHAPNVEARICAHVEPKSGRV